MARTQLVIANWKMNTTLESAQSLASELVPALAEVNGPRFVVCPPFPWLTEVGRILAGSGIALGAQNMHFLDGGHYTGEVSPAMLRGLCQYVLLGQYERRIYFAEKDATVNRKVIAAQQKGMVPMLCVGETADQLDDGSAPAVVAQQLELALEEAKVGPNLVVVYDPVWTTIGMASPPGPGYANDMCGFIRATLRSLYDPAAVDQVPIVYGGSVTVRNIGEVAEQPNLDGVMVGASSLSASNFSLIARTFAEKAAARV